MAASSAGDVDENQFAAATVGMPRGAEPLLRRAVGGCGVDTHVERLKRNAWGRHTCDRWVTFVLFPPAVADLTLWSPDGRHQAIHLTGGRTLTIPPGWSFSLVWHKTAVSVAPSAPLTGS